MMNLLLLEDDYILSKEIKLFLESNAYSCDCVFDGSLVVKQYRLKPYDLIILDINVPNLNGFEVCLQIRTIDKKIPIIMLTAFDEIDDKINAFNNGADDYLVKPFHLAELLARIKSLLRRKDTEQVDDEIIYYSDLVVNLSEMTVQRGGIPLNLTPKEMKLLTILLKANGRILNKAQIANELWDYHIETNQNTIEVYINFLRKKIDKDFDTKLIHTKVGFGYYIKEE
mgnify:FL=1